MSKLTSNTKKLCKTTKYFQFCQVFWAWKVNNIHGYKVARDVISCQVKNIEVGNIPN
jgi:hypothetical protein